MSLATWYGTVSLVGALSSSPVAKAPLATCSSLSPSGPPVTTMLSSTDSGIIPDGASAASFWTSSSHWSERNVYGIGCLLLSKCLLVEWRRSAGELLHDGHRLFHDGARDDEAVGVADVEVGRHATPLRFPNVRNIITLWNRAAIWRLRPVAQRARAMWRTRSWDSPAASPTWRRLWPASTAST